MKTYLYAASHLYHHFSGLSFIAKSISMMIRIINIMNKPQETTVFSGCQNLTSALKLRPEK